MTPYVVLTYPNPALSTACQPVEDKMFGSQELRDIALRMHATMKKNKMKGIGLAANQVGIPLQILVINTVGVSKPPYLGTLVNPEIVEYSGDISAGEEGCLSFPSDRYYVSRSTSVRVKFKDIDGNDHDRKFTGLNAVVVQHEVDHLRGITMKDRNQDG